MSPLTLRIGEREFSFPRVSGDEPIRSVVIRDLLAFSPRERG